MSADEIKNRIVYILCRTDKTEDDGTDIIKKNKKLKYGNFGI